MRSFTYYQLNFYKEFSNLNVSSIIVYSAIRKEFEKSDLYDVNGKYSLLTIRKISYESCTSERTVQRALRELVESNLISIDNEISHSGCKFRVNEISTELTPLYDEKTPVVYFFKDKNDEIIYIGKTIDINDRMENHDHLPKECYDSVRKIEYIEIGNVKDMDFLERHLIIKLKPKYNTEFVHESTLIDVDISRYEKKIFSKKINFRNVA